MSPETSLRVFFSSRKTQAALILTTGPFATIRKAPEISSTKPVLRHSTISDASKRLRSESMIFVSPAGKGFRYQKLRVRPRKVHHREQNESDDNSSDSDFFIRFLFVVKKILKIVSGDKITCFSCLRRHVSPINSGDMIGCLRCFR